jgi:hydrogenase expression/formation protein HypC
MCLSVPGKVLEINNEDGIVMGRVDFSGVAKRVCLHYVPDIKVGEYALVHVGFAIGKIDEEEAAKSLKLIKELQHLQNDLDRDSIS